MKGTKDPKKGCQFIHTAFVLFVIFVVRLLSDVNDWILPDSHVPFNLKFDKVHLIF